MADKHEFKVKHGLSVNLDAPLGNYVAQIGSVAGTGMPELRLGAYGSMIFQTYQTGHLFGEIVTGTGEELRLHSGTAGSTQFVLDPSGNVGIGTDTPASLLELALGVNDGSLLMFNSGGADRFSFDINGTGADYLKLKAHSETAQDNIMVWLTNGNVGIGKADPSVALDVVGSAVISGDLTVQGTTVTLNTTNLDVEDKIITVNKNETGPDVGGDGLAGLEVERGLAPNANLVFDAAVDAFTWGIDGTNYPIARTEADAGMVNYGIPRWDTTNKIFYTDSMLTSNGSKVTINANIAPTSINNNALDILNPSGVCIGMHSPSLHMKLFDSDSADPNDFWRIEHNGGGLHLFCYDNSAATNTALNYFTNDGDVGIGVTPSTRFTIKSKGIGNSNGFMLMSAGDSNRVADIYESEDGDGAISLSKNNVGYTVRFMADGNSYFNGGYLGIGTDNPGSPLNVYRNNATDTPLVNIYDDDAANTNRALHIYKDGNGVGLNIDHNGNGSALYIDSQSTTSYAARIIPNGLTTGTAFDIYANGPNLSSGRLMSVQQNLSSASLANRSNQTAYFGNNRQYTGTGTVNDDFSVMSIQRIDQINNASGTLNSSGSILTLNNQMVVTAGTHDNDVTALKVVHGSRSSNDVFAVSIQSDNYGSGKSGGIDFSSFSANEILMKFGATCKFLQGDGDDIGFIGGGIKFYNPGDGASTARLFFEDSTNYGGDFYRTMVFESSTSQDAGGWEFWDSNADATRMKIRKDGKVGINTRTPEQKLTLKDGDIKIERSYGVAAGNIGQVRFGTDHATYGAATYAAVQGQLPIGTNTIDLAFLTGYQNTTKECMRLKHQTGRIGIGTSDPGTNVHIYEVDSTVGIYPQLEIENYTAVVGTMAAIQLRSFNFDSYIAAYTNGATNGGRLSFMVDHASTGPFDAMSILSTTGYVGIGTSAPSSILDVEDVNPSVTVNSVGTTNQSQSLLLQEAGTNSAGFIQYGSTHANASELWIKNYTAGAAMKFAPNGGGTEAMTILSNLNVGIGNTSPATMLEISSDSSWMRASHTNGVGTYYTDYGYGLVDNHGGTLSLRCYGPIQMQTGGANTRMYFTTSGNIGVGTTDPQGAFHVNGDLIIGSTADNNTRLKWGLPSNGTFQIHNRQGTDEQRLSMSDADTTYGSSLIFEQNSSGLTQDTIDDASIKFIVKSNGTAAIGSSAANEALTINGTGRISLKETTTPSVTSGYGKIYAKSADSDLYYLRDDGVDINISGTSLGGIVIVGSPVDGQVTYWKGANSIAGETGFTWDETNNRLRISNMILHSPGTGNSFVGQNCGTLTSGAYNSFFGNNAGAANTTGAYNTYIGDSAGSGATTALKNVAVGDGAGQSYGAGSSHNTAIGYVAGANNNNASGYNTFLGAYAGYNSTGTSNVFIGYQAGQNDTGNNKLYIDNSSTATPLIYGDFASNYVTVHGTFKAYQSAADSIITAETTDSGSNAILRLKAEASRYSEIKFSNPGNDTDGRIFYDHTNNYMDLWAGGQNRVRVATSNLWLQGGVGLALQNPTNDNSVYITNTGGVASSVLDFATGAMEIHETGGYVNIGAVSSGISPLTIKAMSSAYALEIEDNTTGNNVINMYAYDNVGPAISLKNATGSQRVWIDGRNDTTSRHTYFMQGGNVGIGVSVPTQKLDVRGMIVTQAGSDNGVSFDYGYPTSHGHIYYDSSASKLTYMGYYGHRWHTSSGEKVRILQTGEVGIGTTSPNTKLQVNGVIRSAGTTGADAPEISLHSSGYWDWNIVGDGNDLKFSHDSTQRMVINSSGYVGIGTDTPTYALDVRGKAVVYGTESDDILKIKSDTNVVGHESGIKFYGGATWYKASIAAINQNTGNAGGDLVFRTGSSTSLIDRMIIKSNGYVGIGTTSPSANFEVSAASGIVRFLIDSVTNTDGGMILGDSGSYKWYITKSAHPTNTFSIGRGTGAETWADDFNILHSNGYVGIGTASPGKLLDVSSAAAGVIRITGYNAAAVPDNAQIAKLEFATAYNLAGGYACRAAIFAQGRTSDYEPATDLVFTTSNTDAAEDEKMRLMYDGDLGLGLSAPALPFHIYRASGNDVKIRLQQDTNYWDLGTDSGSNIFDIKYAGSDVVNIVDGGIVTIKGASPSITLDDTDGPNQTWTATNSGLDLSYSLRYIIKSGSTEVARFEGATGFRPGSDDTYDCGTSSYRWANVYATNVYTGDLHMKNEKGDWTLEEEAEYLIVTNNKTGKKFKLVMEELS